MENIKQFLSQLLSNLNLCILNVFCFFLWGPQVDYQEILRANLKENSFCSLSHLVTSCAEDILSNPPPPPPISRYPWQGLRKYPPLVLATYRTDCSGLLFFWGEGMISKEYYFCNEKFLHGSCRLNDNISAYWDRNYTFSMENEGLDITLSTLHCAAQCKPCKDTYYY